MWALPGDRPLAVTRPEGTIEHRQVLGLQLGRAFDRVVLVNVGHDRFHLGVAVAQRPQRQRHGLVDDLQHTAAGQLLVLDQGDIRLDARGVAIHHETDRARGGQHRGLGIAEAIALAVGQHLVPEVAGGLLQMLWRGLDLLDLLPVHLHHAQHRLAVLVVVVEWPHGRGQLGAGVAGRTVQDGRDRRRTARGLRPNHRPARPS